MSIQTSNTNTEDDITIKRYAATKKTYKPYFYVGSLHYACLNLDPNLIQQLGITDDTEFTQIITPEGILLRRRKEI